MPALNPSMGFPANKWCDQMFRLSTAEVFNLGGHRRGAGEDPKPPPHLPWAPRRLTEQLHCTHWLGWRLGKSSLVVNISPCWYVVPLYWQDLAGARSPEGEFGSGKEDKRAAG